MFYHLRHTLKTAVRVCALAAIFFLAPAVAADVPNPCIDRPIALKAIFFQGFAYAGTFITDQAIVMQLYVRAADGAWLWIGVAPDMKYCVLISGAESAFAIERAH